MGNRAFAHLAELQQGEACPAARSHVPTTRLLSSPTAPVHNSQKASNATRLDHAPYGLTRRVVGTRVFDQNGRVYLFIFHGSISLCFRSLREPDKPPPPIAAQIIAVILQVRLRRVRQ